MEDFWNKIELIWIILAGFGVYGAIYGTWIDVRTFISKIYLDGVAVDVTQSKDAANYLIAGYCTASDADKNLCNTLHKISEFIDYSDYRAIGDINSTLFSSNVKFQYDDINRKYFSDIRTNWDNAHLMSRDAAYELSRQLPSANYVGWLGYFWPHCLAIGFALRLSRAIAVFKL